MPAPTPADIQTFRFADAGAFPNNPRLPVLVYRQAAPLDLVRRPDNFAAWFKQIWPPHGWQPAWRWGVYGFPHYHSTAHEALGVYRGHASLRLGDRTGATLVVEAGDLVILPVGTSHQNLGASSDFHVVGGYPEGQEADLLRGAASDRPAADERIARVPAPRSDPLLGADGPLMKYWG